MFLKELLESTTLNEGRVPSYSQVAKWLESHEKDVEACAEYVAKLAGFESLKGDSCEFVQDSEGHECIAYASSTFVYVLGPTRRMFDNVALENSSFSFAKIRQGNWDLIEDAPGNLIEKTSAGNFNQALALLRKNVA
jgi:hypothetical protein